MNAPSSTASLAPDSATQRDPRQQLDPALAVLDDAVEQARFTHYSSLADGQRVAESTLRITGMHCAACAGIIEQAVGRVAGVLSVRVSASGERASIRWDPAQARVASMVLAVRRAGYDAMPDAAQHTRLARLSAQRSALWRLFVAAFCAMQVMMLATPSYVSEGNDLSAEMRQLLNWGSWLLSLPVMAFSCGPFFRSAWGSLRAGCIGMDVPVCLGVAVTFVASSGATFDPGGAFGSEVYFDSLTMFVSFLLAGRWLELRARHRVAQSLESALVGMPEVAVRVLSDGCQETVAVHHLRVGDHVRVALGQAFPADGSLVQGQTRVDERLLSGESRPVDKPSGADVAAGSINLSAPVLMIITRSGDDTRLQGIVAMMRQALTERPAMLRSADRWAAPFLWTVLLLAAAGAAVWSVIDPSQALWVTVSVLIVTCPCALSLAAPAALLSATSALARRGIWLQRLDALDVWLRVQRVYFDKTGTLTDDGLRWRGLQRLDAGGPVFTDGQLLALAGSLAAHSRHPLSVALAGHAGNPAGAGWHHVTEQAGQGLEAIDARGEVWRLGSRASVGAPPSSEPDDAASAIWLGRQQSPLVRFDFEESLRPGAREAVVALRQRGIEVILLTGDRPVRAERLAQDMEFNRVIGGATPASKLAELTHAQAIGLCVAMVGDGVNDAPVLARADVSFAMGQGALVARLHADAVIASNRLTDLVFMHDLGLRTRRVVNQNLAWAAAYNLTCVPLALLGWLPPWAAGLGMASSSALVVLNALRLAR